MNYVIRNAQEHTLGCVASPGLCNLGIKQRLRVTAQCLGDVRAYNIVEANFTGVSRLILTDPCHWGGERLARACTPLPQGAQTREQPSMASGRPLRLALVGAYACRRALARCRLGGYMEVDEKGDGWGRIRFTNHTINASGLSTRGTDNLGHDRIDNEDIPTDMIPIAIKVWKENRIVALNIAKSNRKDLAEKAMIKQLALDTRSQTTDSFGIGRPTREIDLE